MVIIEHKNTATQSIFDFGSGIFYSATTNLLELEEVLSIVVADIFNHLVYAFHFRYRNFSVFYVTSYQVTQCTAEIFMTRVG